MATGPEHYRNAERLLAEITTGDGLIITNVSDIASYLAAAQAHATLALAAAMGTCGNREARTSADIAAWESTAGEHTAQKDRQAAIDAGTTDDPTDHGSPK